MSIRVVCPECESPCRVGEDLIGKKVRCTKCGETFRAEPPEEAIQDQPIRKASGGKKPTLAPPRKRTLPEPKSNGLLLGLVLGGAGLLLIAGGVLLIVVLRPKASGQADAPAVAQVNPDKGAVVQPAQGAPPANAEKPLAEVPAANEVPANEVLARVEPAPAVGNGKEQFVDLPERGEGLNGIAGVNFGPAEQPPPAQGNPPPARPNLPAEAAAATLANASATRNPRMAGMVFRVDYSFPNGRPAGTRFAWIIVPRTGLPFKVTYVSAELRASGTLSCRGPAAAHGPYQCFLAVEKFVPGKLGLQEVRISDILTFR